jgi:predicted dehydrogenase
MTLQRREFIRNSALAGLGLAFLPQVGFGQPIKKTLKMGFIGLGLRGEEHLKNALHRTDIEVVAICDIDKVRQKKAIEMLKEKGAPPALIFGDDPYDYRNLLKLANIDAVVIATPWLWHTPMSIDAMKAGKYTGVEVSAAMTLEECWDLVNTHEATGSQLMIMENVNYRRDVMAVLNMVRKNVFGELLHLRCGYQHDLREVKFNDGIHPYGHGVEFGEKGISEARWRTQHSLKRNADIYPTHGLGPVATYCNINRGNRLVSLTSHATKSRGLHKHIVDVGGENHPNAKLKWKLGDIVTSTVDTANGETIIITHDTNSPRPYSLGFRVQGTNGIWEVDGNRIYIEGEAEKAHRWDDATAWLEKYDHPLWKRFGNDAEGAGHGGMDFFVMNAFVESAKRLIPPPIDAYDAASWSAVTPLSEASIAEGGQVQQFPDFTRGKWIKRKPYNWIKNTY